MMWRSVTLLPVPLRPRMTKPQPAGTSNDTSSSTLRRPNDFVT